MRPLGYASAACSLAGLACFAWLDQPGRGLGFLLAALCLRLVFGLTEARVPERH